MANYRSTRYTRFKQARRREGIEAYYRHKAAAELIPENDHVMRPKIRANASIIMWFDDKPQMQFSLYRLPWGWSISPTLAGQKVQQVLMRA
jgi:hypothetical protein